MYDVNWYFDSVGCPVALRAFVFFFFFRKKSFLERSEIYRLACIVNSGHLPTFMEDCIGLIRYVNTVVKLLDVTSSYVPTLRVC